MQELHQPLLIDEEETLVTPRFDDEETIVARRVVPLEEVGQAAPAVSASARPYTRPSFAPRRRWALALVVVSALVGGGVLGGAGLYLYQSRASAHATNAPATQQTNAPANATAAAPQPTPAPTVEVVNEQSSAPTSSQDSETRTDETNGASVEARDASKDAVDGDQAGSPKRGKKGARDEEIQRDERRAKHSDPDNQLSRADTDGDRDRSARRVDTITIFERPRRASRRDRARSDAEADRLRRIFEGQP